MIVHSIEWLSQDAQEAVVTIVDGNVELVCFSQPFRTALGSKLTERIHGFDASEVMRARTSMALYEKTGMWSYFLRGQYMGNGAVLIETVSVYINEALIPKDIINGEFVEFFVSRLDLY
jgi:hypothetical protein